MTQSEQEAERKYLSAERIGIITQGEREPTAEEQKSADAEAANTVRKITLNEILKSK